MLQLPLKSLIEATNSTSNKETFLQNSYQNLRSVPYKLINFFITLMYFSKKYTLCSPCRGGGRSRSSNTKTYDTSSSSDAQKKFGSAKAISSDQFFGGNSSGVS